MSWRTYALSRSVSIALRHDAEGRVVEAGEVTVAEGVAGSWEGEMARHAARAPRRARGRRDARRPRA